MNSAKNIVSLLMLALATILFSACSSSQRFSSKGRACPVNINSASIDKNQGQAEVQKKEPSIARIPRNEKLTSIQAKIIANAESWIGVPYLWGGNTRNGVDCSGFVKNIYQDVGINLPRTAQLQFNFAKKIADKERKSGDLVFFKKGSRITHVGIYVGENEIIHSSSGKGVIRQSLSNNYLQSIYAGAGRVID